MAGKGGLDGLVQLFLLLPDVGAIFSYSRNYAWRGYLTWDSTLKGRKDHVCYIYFLLYRYSSLCLCGSVRAHRRSIAIVRIRSKSCFFYIDVLVISLFFSFELKKKSYFKNSSSI
ncbi:hypothetical protein F4775DRAFT_563584 [Biscogniauxia sp. FL1348]|nr:hypothetical protein F4775DRAFT_563584 [Biscogniauxia sp. FL1348]